MIYSATFIFVTVTYISTNLVGTGTLGHSAFICAHAHMLRLYVPEIILCAHESHMLPSLPTHHRHFHVRSCIHYMDTRTHRHHFLCTPPPPFAHFAGLLSNETKGSTNEQATLVPWRDRQRQGRCPLPPIAFLHSTQCGPLVSGQNQIIARALFEKNEFKIF